jgi:hypothetical protein
MDYSVLTVLSGLVAMCAAVWKIAQDFRTDLEQTSALLFKRFDDHKDTTDKKFIYSQELNDKKYQRSDICEMSRLNYAKDIEEIKMMIRIYSDKIDKILESRSHDGKG